jgi:hypothetical protein
LQARRRPGEPAAEVHLDVGQLGPAAKRRPEDAA